LVEQRKQAVSIRLSEGCTQYQTPGAALAVRDSDIIRFAIKSMLNRSPAVAMTPSGEESGACAVESGDELIRYFEIDAYRLETSSTSKRGRPCASIATTSRFSP